MKKKRRCLRSEPAGSNIALVSLYARRIMKNVRDSRPYHYAGLSSGIEKEVNASSMQACATRVCRKMSKQAANTMPYRFENRTSDRASDLGQS